MMKYADNINMIMKGIGPIYPLPIHLNELLLMTIDIPLLDKYAIPRNIVIVESVVIIGLIFALLTINPLNAPQAIPRLKAMIIAKAIGIPDLRRIAQTIPVNAIILPTEISIHPWISANVVVVAVTPIIAE